MTNQHFYIGSINDVFIFTEHDPNVEPGHEWLLISTNTPGLHLARLLWPEMTAAAIWLDLEFADGRTFFRIPHNAQVDENLRTLVNLAADIRNQAPGLVQLSLNFILPGKNNVKHPA